MKKIFLALTCCLAIGSAAFAQSDADVAQWKKKYVDRGFALDLSQYSSRDKAQPEVKTSQSTSPSSAKDLYPSSNTARTPTTHDSYYSGATTSSSPTPPNKSTTSSSVSTPRSKN